MTTKTKLDTNRKDARLNACVCGCGTEVRGRFAQGHDQRVRGMLLRGELTAALKAALKAGLVLKAVAHANARILRQKAA